MKDLNNKTKENPKVYIVYAEDIYEDRPGIIGIATSDTAAIEMIQTADRELDCGLDFFYDSVDLNTMCINGKKLVFSDLGQLISKKRTQEEIFERHNVELEKEETLEYEC